MAQVSKRPLTKEKLDKVFDLFFDFVVNVYSKAKARKVLGEMLTETEKIMLSKRIACLYLLAKNAEPSEIGELLKLSQATIHHYKYIYKNSPEIKIFLEKRLHTDGVKSILKDVFIEFFYGQPRPGSDWSHAKRTLLEHRRRRKEKF